MAKSNDSVKALTVTRKELVMVFDTSGTLKITLRLRDPKTNIIRDDVEPVMQQAITNSLFATTAGDVVTAINTAYIQQLEEDKLM